MRILIIIPKFTYNNLTTKPNYNYAFPIGIGYILAVLKKRGYEVDCLNLNHYEGTVQEIVKKQLDEKKYDVVGTGSMALDYLMIEKIIDTCKAHETKPIFILGGMIITSEPNLISENLKFDIGVIGEAEETIIELIDALEKKKDLSRIDGICYQKDGKTFFTKSRKPVENLDKIPFPDFDGVGYEKILDNMSSGDSLYAAIDYPRTYTIYGSRGCPFQCTFCYHGGKYRVRSVDNIIKELEYAIEKYKINSFNLNDDLFSINKERLNEFCEKIKILSKKVPGRLVWRCSLWVGAVDEEMLRKLKNAGCLFAGLGFESYSPLVLKSMIKPITPKQIDDAIKSCMKVHMPIEGNFIFGDKAETKETAMETLDYWKNNCRGQVKLYFIHPYPGSQIYQHCIEKGLIKDKLDFIKYRMHHTNILNMTGMSDKEWETIKKEIYKAKIEYERYVVPQNIKKMQGFKNRYEVEIKCPFCNEKFIYKNLLFKNKTYFNVHTVCRNDNCRMRFFICSRLYRFTTKNYLTLDFLRKNYLIIRDSILRKNL